MASVNFPSSNHSDRLLTLAIVCCALYCIKKVGDVVLAALDTLSKVFSSHPPPSQPLLNSVPPPPVPYPIFSRLPFSIFSTPEVSHVAIENRNIPYSFINTAVDCYINAGIQALIYLPGVRDRIHVCKENLQKKIPSNPAFLAKEVEINNFLDEVKFNSNLKSGDIKQKVEDSFPGSWNDYRLWKTSKLELDVLESLETIMNGEQYPADFLKPLHRLHHWSNDASGDFIDQTRSYGQQDAQEYLRYILDILDMSTLSTYSENTYFHIRSCIYSYIRSIPDIENTISTSLQQNDENTVQTFECLDKFLKNQPNELFSFLPAPSNQDSIQEILYKQLNFLAKLLKQTPESAETFTSNFFKQNQNQFAQSKEKDKSSFLSLGMKVSHPTAHSCIQHHFDPEMIEVPIYEDSTHTPHKNVLDGQHDLQKVGGLMKKQLWIESEKQDSLPPVLCIHYKKYHLDQKSTLLRIDSIEPQEQIDLRSYIKTPDTGLKTTYKLSSYIVQKGGLSAGHYTASVCMKGQYYSCNDLSIQQISQDAFLKGAYEAYLLFYTKLEG